jgi:hypothetical protein
MHARGVAAVRGDGTYNAGGELVIDARLAAILMAGFAAIVYFTARLLLPVPWSLAIALVSGFGTQVFSTTSRSMWSDTWGIALVGLAAFVTLRSTARAERLNVPLVATLEAWAYMVRPTNSIVLIGTALYVIATDREDIWRFLVTVAGWLAIFFAYSWTHFGKLLPDYFAATRLRFADPASALLGNLVSPGRGLLVYVPAVIAVVLLLARYWRTIRFRRLAWLAAFVIGGHMVMLAGFEHWWGGHCYGARLTTSLVPWMAILAILGSDARRRAALTGGLRMADHVLAFAAVLLCIASIAINAIGAFSLEASKWNISPENIDRSPGRLWSWQRPQFLAPLLEPTGPFMALPGEGLPVGAPQADQYLGLGWAFAEGDFRWTDGRGGAVVRFSLANAGPGLLDLDLRPYLVPGKVTAQRLLVSMNGHDVGAFLLHDPEFATHTIEVRAAVASRENIVRLRLPDAASPAVFERSPDRRDLGVAVRLVRWRPAPVL